MARITRTTQKYWLIDLPINAHFIVFLIPLNLSTCGYYLNINSSSQDSGKFGILSYFQRVDACTLCYSTKIRSHYSWIKAPLYTMLNVGNNLNHSLANSFQVACIDHIRRHNIDKAAKWSYPYAPLNECPAQRRRIH